MKPSTFRLSGVVQFHPTLPTLQAMIRVDRVALVIALLSILVNFGHSISDVRESLSLKHYHTHYNPYILPLPTLTNFQYDRGRGRAT